MKVKVIGRPDGAAPEQREFEYAITKKEKLLAERLGMTQEASADDAVRSQKRDQQMSSSNESKLELGMPEPELEANQTDYTENYGPW